MTRLNLATLAVISVAAVCSSLALRTSAPTKSAEFDHHAIHVRDLTKSADFYERLLRLPRIPDPFKDGRHIFLSMGQQTELHLIAGATAVPEQDIDVHFAFRVQSVEEFASRLKVAQVPYYNSKHESGKITVRPDGVKQVYLQDPDGYWIEINDSRR
jgi:lactoylglutathione lyase